MNKCFGSLVHIFVVLIMCRRLYKSSVLALFFFFQAEDGIRDLVRSRGLGDVYKRQEYYDAPAVAKVVLAAPVGNLTNNRLIIYNEIQSLSVDTVSYTHLTLPTIYSV